MKALLHLTTLLHLALQAAPAAAWQPRYVLNAQQSAAMTELVVAGEITAVHTIAKAPKHAFNRRVLIKVTRVLKGSYKQSILEMRYVDAGHRGPVRLTPKMKRLFYLNRDISGTFFRSVNRDAGVGEDSPANRKKVAAARGCCKWKQHAHGVRLMVLPGKPGYKRGEQIELTAWVLHEGSSTVQWTRVPWPKSKMTWAELQVTLGKQKIKPRPIPWAKKSNIEKAAKQDKPYTETMPPGTLLPYYLQRINTADSGYGYKERLGSVHYPMTKAGRYKITVKLHHVIKQAPLLVSNPVTVEIK